jgi:hypothetical protein
MYNHKDILILGDSHAQYRNSYDYWPYIIYNKLTNKEESPRGKGLPGASWWAIRKELLKELEIQVPKLLIIVHPYPMRMPSDSTNGFRPNSYLTPKTIKEVKQKIAIQLYYKFLASYEYHVWANKQWFIELDTLVINIEKVIHLYAINNNYDNYGYIFNKGVMLPNYLHSIKKTGPEYYNHITVQDNKLLANYLLDIILNNYKDGNIY